MAAFINIQSESVKTKLAAISNKWQSIAKPEENGAM